MLFLPPSDIKRLSLSPPHVFSLLLIFYYPSWLSPSLSGFKKLNRITFTRKAGIGSGPRCKYHARLISVSEQSKICFTKITLISSLCLSFSSWVSHATYTLLLYCAGLSAVTGERRRVRMGRQRQMVHLLPTQPVHSHAQAARLLFFLLIPSNSLGFLCAAANSFANNDKLASTTYTRISEISNLENANNWRLLCRPV
jgi:hypothetical protein